MPLGLRTRSLELRMSQILGEVDSIRTFPFLVRPNDIQSGFLRSHKETDKWYVVTSIKQNTTPAEFDATMAASPTYTLDMGGGCHVISNALCRAAELGNELLVRHLVRRGAPIDLGNEFGATPLMLAVNHRHVNIVAELLRSRANPNLTPCASSRDREFVEKETPLEHAVNQRDHASKRAILELLLEHGAHASMYSLSGDQKIALMAIKGRKAALLRALPGVPVELVMLAHEYGQ